MPLDYPIATHTLDNGLRVVVSQDDAVPLVAVNMWVGVGSRHEQAGGTGLAHLFEHLMFQGSANVGDGEHFASLMAAGGRLNATTWFDRTTYFETVPTGALELALWLEADRQGRLLPALTQANLDNQRDVVVEEKRERYDNQPYGTAISDLGAMVFDEGHPYHHPTIGSMEDLWAATLEDAHAFYRTHYRPGAMVLTMAGDLTPATGFRLAERYFGDLPAGEPTIRPPLPQLAPRPVPARLERHDEVPNDRLYLGFRLPVAHTPELIACAMALDALGGLTISRLHRDLVRQEESAVSVSASALGLIDGASVGIVAIDVAEGVAPERVEDAVCGHLRDFATTGPTPVELEASLADTERSWLSYLAAIDDRAELISHYTLLHDDPDHINRYLDVASGITGDQVRAAAQQWLDPSCRATVLFRPKVAAA